MSRYAPLRKLVPGARKKLCELLWLNLTIAGRAIWSDKALSPEQQRDGLKWVNEAQHTVWGAHAHPENYDPVDLARGIEHWARQARESGGWIVMAWNDSQRAAGHAELLNWPVQPTGSAGG